MSDSAADNDDQHVRPDPDERPDAAGEDRATPEDAAPRSADREPADGPTSEPRTPPSSEPESSASPTPPDPAAGPEPSGPGYTGTTSPTAPESPSADPATAGHLAPGESTPSEDTPSEDATSPDLRAQAPADSRSTADLPGEDTSPDLTAETTGPYPSDVPVAGMPQRDLPTMDEDAAPYGQNDAPYEQEDAPYGHGEAPHEQDGAPHEQDGAPHEQDGAPHEQDGAPHEQDGAPHEQDGAPHEQDGAPHEHGEASYGTGHEPAAAGFGEAAGATPEPGVGDVPGTAEDGTRPDIATPLAAGSDVPGDGEPSTADGGAAGPGEEAEVGLAAASAAGAGGGPSRTGGPGGKGPKGPKGSKRPGKPGKQRRSRGAVWTWRAAYVLGVLILLPVIAFAVVYLMTPIPNSAQPAAKAQQSVFQYSDGKSVIARTGDFDRRPVKLSQVPGPVRDAVISAENRSFYSDSGISIRGSARAAWSTVTGGVVTQGGSTITQQMVRNYYSGLGQQRTPSRKLKEIMIALKVGREKNKNWILQQYLNTIYFGRDTYGIEAAAQAYFDKDVQDLTPAEGAYLASAIQVPSTAERTSDAGARAYMEARWRYVVNGMIQMRAINSQQAAGMAFPLPKKQRQRSIFAGDKGYMVSQAKAELRRMGYTDNQINMGGLKVRTTFDKNLMADAKRAVETMLPPATPKNVMAGLVSIDPRNGEVNAFYGGKNYIDQQFNSAFDAKVQAGSGFKPYVLAAALSHGESLDDYVDGSSPQTFAGKELHNDNNENFGQVNLVTATVHSINTAYINLGQKVGLGKVVDMAEKAGIPAAQLEMHKDAATLPLGVANVTVLQQAAGYASFASEGYYHAPHVIRSVTDRDGKVRTPVTKGKKIFSTTVARDATYAMQKVVDQGTGTNAGLPDRNAAGKTGTTSDGKQLWFNGFIPQMAASVGLFREDNKALHIPGYSSYGGDLPALIWRAYMTQADQDLPPKSFGAPSVYAGTTQPTLPAQPRPRPTGTRPGGGPRPPVPPPSQGPPPPPTEPPPHTGPPTGQPTGNAPRHDRRLEGGAGTF